jgi:hypothetical protein
MKYFLKKDIIHNISGEPDTFPTQYPVFFKFTEEEKDRIQRLFLQASRMGLSSEYRKICVTYRSEECFSIRELIDIMQTVEEIPEEHYNLYLDIPHWDPIQRLEDVLQKFIDLLKSRKKEDIESVAEVLEKYINDTTEGCSDDTIWKFRKKEE